MLEVVFLPNWSSWNYVSLFKIRDLRIAAQVMSGENDLQFSQTSVKYGHDLEKSKRRTIWQDIYIYNIWPGFFEVQIYEHEFLVLNIWTFAKCRKLRLPHPCCKLSCSRLMKLEFTGMSFTAWDLLTSSLESFFGTVRLHLQNGYSEPI